MTIRVISLGAGVQSTTMSLMAKHGELTPMPDCAIFADTGWEPKAVYSHLDWLESVLPFTIYRVSIGNLKEDQLAKSNGIAKRVAAVPWFTEQPDGRGGLGIRQCTTDYKIAPIRRKIRELLGGKTEKASCEQWMGISTDEIIRMKDSRVKYIVHRFPLIDARLNRNDCLRWLERQGYKEPPKSACIGCPFHSDRMWRELRNNSPEEWADAVAVDKAIRRQPGFRGEQFMHRSLKPLDEVDLSTPEDHGQLSFLSECEGMCGI